MLPDKKTLTSVPGLLVLPNLQQVAVNTMLSPVENSILFSKTGQPKTSSASNQLDPLSISVELLALDSILLYFISCFSLMN
jgi:hypothetical protein